MLRLIISSKNKSKATTNFQKSGGWGSVQIRCQTSFQTTAANLSFRIWIGDGEVWQTPRGPFCHNFAENAFCDLPPSSGLWDFNVAVNPTTRTFTVCLEETSELHTPVESESNPTPVKTSAQTWRCLQVPTPQQVGLLAKPANPNLNRAVLDPNFATLNKIIEDDWAFSSSDDDSHGE
jgi:hypothetical protein